MVVELTISIKHTQYFCCSPENESSSVILENDAFNKELVGIEPITGRSSILITSKLVIDDVVKNYINA